MLIENDSLAYQSIDSSNQDQAVRRICYMNNIKSSSDQYIQCYGRNHECCVGIFQEVPKAAVRELNTWELIDSNAIYELAPQ